VRQRQRPLSDLIPSCSGRINVAMEEVVVVPPVGGAASGQHTFTFRQRAATG
jgi:hypothetical protein